MHDDFQRGQCSGLSQIHRVQTRRIPSSAMQPGTFAGHGVACPLGLHNAIIGGHDLRKKLRVPSAPARPRPRARQSRYRHSRAGTRHERPLPARPTTNARWHDRQGLRSRVQTNAHSAPVDPTRHDPCDRSSCGDAMSPATCPATQQAAPHSHQAAPAGHETRPSPAHGAPAISNKAPQFPSPSGRFPPQFRCI